MPKKNKIVLLHSTLHEGAKISENNSKPAIIINYNENQFEYELPQKNTTMALMYILRDD